LNPTGLLLALALVTQAPAPPDAVPMQRRLAELQARLGTVDQQLSALKKRRKGALVEMQAIALQADRARALADAAHLKRDQTQLEVAAITSRKEVIGREIFKRRGELRRQVRWMQALGPLGEFSFFTSLSSFQDYVVRGRYVAYLSTQERRRLDRIQGLQADLVRQEQDLQVALNRLLSEEKDAQQFEGSLHLHEERLQAFLDGLKQDEGRQKEVQASLAEEALQLERMLTNLLAKPRPDPFEGGSVFASLRGELPQPTPGSLAQSFGEHLHPKFKTRTMSSGLLIAADGGAPVQAVAEGKVVYADLYQSFGPMVILDHGGGFFSLYTHLQGLSVARGQILKQAEILGSVGETMDGPRLGFEIRHLTQPQDPNPWLKQRYREAAPVARKR